MDARDIIKKPLVTEKSMSQMAENKYSFAVDKRANKIQIKKAVEEIFKVKVIDVKTMNMVGKTRRMGRFVGKTPDWKKAIVQLAEGNSIEIFKG
jgi:large subunit ribosomal protein L23